MTTEKKVGLASRVNYPVTIKYDGDSIVIPPKKKLKKKEFLPSKLEGVEPNEVAIIR
jgi:hypothetical protein